MDLKELDILGDDIARHWYYRAKAKALRRCIGDRPARRILDVGAGSGFFSKELLRRTDAVAALCIDPSYDADRDEVCAGKPIGYRREPSAVGPCDLVLMMDVIEHVDDDVALLGDYVRRAPSGARFVVSVPAFQCLWSGHDVFLGHRRRYTRRALVETVVRSGLRLERSMYYFALVLPLALITRLASRLGADERLAPRSQLTRHSRPVNALLYAACAAELPLLRYNRLAGLTVFAVARKD